MSSATKTPASRVSYRDTSADAVARGIGIDVHFVCWEQVPQLSAEALVLHMPWARVAIARTASGAHRFLDDYWRGRNTWILDSLQAVYPAEALPPLPPNRALEQPTANKALADFLRWGVSRRTRSAWPVAPHLRVIGSWTSYRDAILLRLKDGRVSVRTRPEEHNGERPARANLRTAST